MQNIVSIWCVAARKLCLVVDSYVKVWSCTLSYKNCHLTLLCLQNNLGTILTIFAKFKYYFDFDQFAITSQPFKKWRIMSLSHFHRKALRTSASLTWEIAKQLNVFSCFSFQNLICYFSIWWKEEYQQLITYNKLIELFLVDFLINVRKNCNVWSSSIFYSFVRICDIYLENSLLNFYLDFDVEKTTPVYIPTHLVIFFIYNQPSHLLYALELQYASFYYCRKWSPKMFVVKNWFSI